MANTKQPVAKDVALDPVSGLLNYVDDWRSATGSDRPRFAAALILDAVRSVPQRTESTAEDVLFDFQRTADTLKGIAPENEVEGMLAVQMLSAHNAATECMGKAMQNIQYPEAMAYYLKMCDKLMRTYTMQMEALNRNRGKGQQHITVEHVSVSDGGQAVVGMVNHSQADRGGQRGSERNRRAIPCN